MGPRRLPERVRVEGKFLYLGQERFDLRGVTYGPFRPPEAKPGQAKPGQANPNRNDNVYGDPTRVAADFRAIAAAGFRTVRTYTVPPRWLLDLAHAERLQLMIGLAWEQHVTFLDDPAIARRILADVPRQLRESVGHPAVLCYAIGNEIPASIVRYHGARRIERFLHRLQRAVKRCDPSALVTYVNYPTTEYLELPFLDFLCFNVYLEQQDRLAAYLARLQNLAGPLPLVMAEVGLCSQRHGVDRQAESLSWQIRTVFQAGCAGVFLFAWTDEWHRGGHDILDWSFGLVDRDRRPKPALTAVCATMQDPLLPSGASWPRVSVVVCSFNGEATIGECLEHVVALDYPNFEVIVINDGSTDRTPAIAAGFDVRKIDQSNGGLSHARNVGMRAARGEIIAYLDDDAYPDPHWLSYIAIAFLTSEHVGIGGPNLPPVEDGLIADCVAHAPGGPSHVLFSDTQAEHLTGCNMAFRAEAIRAIGGFDTRFRIAGDDVDLCWRLLEQGGTLGFHAGAVVWHHRRASIRTYWRQQRNYGRAEGMLEQKWPGKYNRLGHLRWAGQVYGIGQTRLARLRKPKVHHGVWGSRLFQPMYGGATGSVWYVTLMPEWYLATVGLVVFCLVGLSWTPLLWVAVPACLLALCLPVAHVIATTIKTHWPGHSRSFGRSLIVAGLHVMQPLARLTGRLQAGLTPWRWHGAPGWSAPHRSVVDHWSETWCAAERWLKQIERTLQDLRALVRRGGDCDRHDLQVTCGLWGGSRLVLAVEEHGGGRQLLRLKVWPRWTRATIAALVIGAILTLAAAFDGAWLTTALLGGVSLLLLIRSVLECGRSLHTIRCAVALLNPDTAKSESLSQDIS